MGRCIFAAGSLILIGAFIAVGIAFFGPFWLENVPARESPTNQTFIFLYPFASGASPLVGGGGWIYVRGLWAQCGVQCQWFWEDYYSLQKMLFTPLGWHIATQVMYFVGAAFVLLSVIYANIQMCCYERQVVFRLLGAILLISFILQTAAVATFGGGAWRVYTARSNVPLLKVDWSTTSDVYFGWCYWMAVAGGGLTLISGILFLIYDRYLERRKGAGKK